MTSAAHSLPEAHIESLQSLEAGYWWYVGRVEWACSILTSQYSKTLPLKRYADLGCGTGGFAKELDTRFGFEKVALVDLDPAMLKRVPLSPHFDVLSRDFSKPFTLPWKADVISCMDVLEHIEDDSGFLSCARSQLKENGLLVLSVPAHQALYSDWDRQLGHYRRYNKHTLHACLDKAGFQVLESSYQWSFLSPIAPYRKLRQRFQRQRIEFPKVSPWVNNQLIRASRWERRLSRVLPAPFGTSLMIGATPKGPSK